MDLVRETEADTAALEAAMAEVCGVLNGATGRLVELIARVLENGAWDGWGIHSPEHWVTWKCGVSPMRARRLVAMARRLAELPETKAALEGGELAEDQVAVICRHAPAGIDAEVATLARAATVAQLRRVLGGYAFEEPRRSEEHDQSPPEEPRRVSFFAGEEGSWRLSATLPPDEGALVERALVNARDDVFGGRHPEVDPDSSHVPADVSWADALVTLAESYLAHGAACRPHHQRHQVIVHLDADGPEGHLHGGPVLSGGLGRYLICDASVRAVLYSEGKAVSVGRATRTVPFRTRVVVEERDRGCRVPGCARTRWLHVHHIKAWSEGGPTDTANLVALCPPHHRLHHRGGLGIEGDADEPEGLTFTDARGRPLSPAGRPAAPHAPPTVAAQSLAIPTTAYEHPTGERLHYGWVQFNEVASSN